MRINLQNDLKDCGLYCLQSFYEKYYNNEIKISYLKSNVNYGIKGINILELNSLAIKINLKIESYKINFKELLAYKIRKPIIVLIKNMNYSHYVIVYKKTKKIIYTLDSTSGKVQYNIQDFNSIFAGILLLVEKSNKKFSITDIKSVFTFFSPYKNIIIFLIFIYILISIISLISPYFLKLIIDKVIPSHANKLLNFLFIFFLWLAIIKLLFVFISQYIKDKIFLSIKINLKNKIINTFINSRYKDIKKLSIIDWLRRIEIVDILTEYYSNVLSAITKDTIILISSIIFLLVLDSKMIYICIFTTLLLFIVSIIFKNQRKRGVQSLLDNNLSLNLSYYDILSRHLQLKNTNNTKYILHINNKHVDKFSRSEYKMKYIFNWNNLIAEFILQISYILIIYIGTSETLINKLDFGTFIFFLSMFSLFSISFNNISNTFLGWGEMSKNKDLLEFVMFLKHEKLDVDDMKIQQITKIELRNISYEYEMGHKVIDIKRLIIKENMNLKGPNGSGKSTLLKILYLYLEAKGEFYVNDINIKNIDKEFLREKIFISSNELLPNISLKRFLTNNSKELETLTNNFKKYKIDLILSNNNIDISDLIKNNGNEFSIGQQKIIKLLPLLTRKYSLLLLDEIFENIDNMNVEILSRAILDYQKDAIIINISHNKRDIFNFKKAYEIE